jgi:hypothetical protein
MQGHKDDIIYVRVCTTSRKYTATCGERYARLCNAAAIAPIEEIGDALGMLAPGSATCAAHDDSSSREVSLCIASNLNDIDGLPPAHAGANPLKKVRVEYLDLCEDPYEDGDPTATRQADCLFRALFEHRPLEVRITVL